MQWQPWSLLFFHRIWMISLPSIRCILQWQFSGVPLRVGMDLPALQFFLRITYVSLRHLWQNIFAEKIPMSYEIGYFSLLFCFVSILVLSFLIYLAKTLDILVLLYVFCLFSVVFVLCGRENILLQWNILSTTIWSHQRKVQLILQKVSNYGKFNL